MRHTLKLEAARARMRTLGMTQLELAAHCAVDVRTVQRWFAGQSVELSVAERVAAALGVGTGEVFEGVSSLAESLLSMSLRRVLRLLSARENAFAQGLRTVLGHYDEITRGVSLAAHPLHGFVARFVVPSDRQHGFVVLRVRLSAGDCSLAAVAQIGPRISYRLARLRIEGDRVQLLETFHVHSMRARLDGARELDIWVWGGTDARELILTSEQPFVATLVESPLHTLFDLDAPASACAVCIRPTPMHLRAAGLPPGFDRLVGVREGRVDVPVDD